MTLPLENATYIATACGPASFSEPSSNGNRQIAVPFTISQGDYAGETITWIAAFHGTADKKGRTGVDRIIESLKYMGWEGDDLSELAEADDIRAKELMPSEVELVCSVEKYEGDTRLRVNWVNRLGGGRFTFKEPLAGSDLKSFAAQMRGQIRNAQGGLRKPAGNGATKKQESHPNAPGDGSGFGDGDIPFAHCGFEFDPSPIARVLR